LLNLYSTCWYHGKHDKENLFMEFTIKWGNKLIIYSKNMFDAPCHVPLAHMLSQLWWTLLCILISSTLHEVCKALFCCSGAINKSIASGQPHVEQVQSQRILCFQWQFSTDGVLISVGENPMEGAQQIVWWKSLFKAQ
jgi:hypothetical protein